MTVAPSIAAAISTLSVPLNRGTRPPTMPVGDGASTNRLARQPTALARSTPSSTPSDDQQQARDHPLERALPALVLHDEQAHRHRAGDHSAEEQRQVEE